MCSPAVCDNRVDSFDFVESPARLVAPTRNMVPSQRMNVYELDLSIARWETGERYASSNGTCLYGHTDVWNANRSEEVLFFASDFFAGACIPPYACHWEVGRFLCACVSPMKVAEARRILKHHTQHHVQLAGATLLGIATVCACCQLVLRVRTEMARHCSSVLLILFAFGGFLLMASASIQAPEPPGYWNGCGTVGSNQ